MLTHTTNQNPEGLAAVWRAVHKLENDVEKIVPPEKKIQIWKWMWIERTWFIPTVLMVLASIGAGSWYLGALILDRHIGLAIGPIQNDVVQIKGDLQGIKGTLSGIQLRQLSSTPNNAQNVKEARDILTAAKKGNILIPDMVIQQAGTSFLEAAKTEPKAWEATLDFVSYRTMLNNQLLAVENASQLATTPVTEPLELRYKLNTPTGYKQPQLSVGGEVPSDRAADIHPLGEPSLNQGQPKGREVILVDGGAVVLDGMVMKNVVIRNTLISYSGGPISLSNVIFVNCTFLLPNEMPTREFANTILANSAVSFSTG
jgi:hypothetical protein